jgi:hypothetical protein
MHTSFLRPPFLNNKIKKKPHHVNNQTPSVQFCCGCDFFITTPTWDARPDPWSTETESISDEMSPEPWIFSTSKSLSRNDVSNMPLHPNGMLPTAPLPITSNHIVAPRNGWDIRSLDTIKRSDMVYWRVDDYLDYGLFPTRNVLYGKVQLKSYPIDESEICFCWHRSMLDKSTDTFYMIPEPPNGDFKYHVTTLGSYIFYITWDISFYMLKPFIEEELCNMIDAALDDMNLVREYPEYYNEWNRTKSLKQCKTMKDYFRTVKKALAYNGTLEYDGRIDDYIDENEYYFSLNEYERLHDAVLKLASTCDCHLMQRDEHNRVNYDVLLYSKWTQRTFDEILTIIKSFKCRNHTLCAEDWSHILLSFGEGLMKIFGNFNYQLYRSRFPMNIQHEFHKGTIYESDQNFDSSESCTTFMFS